MDARQQILNGKLTLEDVALHTQPGNFQDRISIRAARQEQDRKRLSVARQSARHSQKVRAALIAKPQIEQQKIDFSGSQQSGRLFDIGRAQRIKSVGS